MLRGKVKFSAAFLARLISCVYQVSFCWCFFCSCSSCCKGDIPSDGDAAKSDPQMDCNPKPNTVITCFEISQGHINKEQMNNSTWLQSAYMHSHWRDWVHFDYEQVNNTANEPSMTQFGHFSAKVYSILDPNSVVYLPCPKLNCLMWTFFVFWLAPLAGNMDPYYRYGISLAWDQAPQWGKRQKRSETLASKASPAVDWGEGYRPFSTPDSLVDFCFVFPPLWTWSHARISRVGTAKTSSLFGHIINPSLTSWFDQDGWPRQWPRLRLGP